MTTKTMKKLLCAFILLHLLGEYKLERIVLHTGLIEKLYHYFPLKCSYLLFNVKASSDVHITLTETYSQLGGFYEIVVGGWRNTKSIIRKDNKNNEVLSRQGAVLKGTNYQRIWLSLNDTEGSISVGKWNEKAFLYYKDPFYTKMSFFGLSTGYGHGGEWYFDDGYLTCDLIGCNLGFDERIS